MRVRGVNHVTFAVADVPAAVGFYRDVLGCHVLATWPAGAYLLAGSTWLALVEGRPSASAAGDYTHLALDVAPDEFAGLASRIRQSAARLWQENWTEGESLYFEDLDGHRLEIHASTLARRLAHAAADPWPGLELALVENASEKWGGVPHYVGTMIRLGEDEHGCWLWGAAGRRISRRETSFITEFDVLTLVPAGEWWTLTWWPGHARFDLYVNISTPARWSDGRVAYVDLDLDVVRWVDGKAEIIDRDEFEENQVRYSYPADLVERADAAAARALDLVERRVAPFDGVAASQWLAALGTRSAGPPDLA